MVEYSGHNLDSGIHVATTWSCQLACANHLDCQFFSFELETGSCYLKSPSWNDTRTMKGGHEYLSGEKDCLFLILLTHKG